MNWLKKGPELKLPKLRKPSLKGAGSKAPTIKAPTFLADLYYDLRDRRLLPLIALVLVAIAAVPFLMGSDPEELPIPPAASAALEAGSAKTSKLTVVEATPGLRDYRKRLKGRSATDPFEQQYVEQASEESSPSNGDASSVTAAEETVATEGSSATDEIETGDGSSGGSGGGGGGGASGPSQGTQLIEFVFDIQISHSEATADGGQKMGEPEVRHRVKTLTQLPSKKVPVVTVAGLNLHNGNVWFLIPNGVESLDGDFTCVTRTPAGICELVEIEPGFPLELEYGPDKVLYRIKVTGIDAISAGKVGDGSRSSRAAFGLTGNPPQLAGSGSVSEIAQTKPIPR